jgi:hypothetical protein
MKTVNKHRQAAVGEYELKQPEWWLCHHKGNVRYLCLRIQKLIENPDDEEYREFFHKHFKACLDDFLKSTYPLYHTQRKELLEWEDDDGE